MSAILKGRWTQQPPLAQLDPGHRLYDKIVCAIPGNLRHDIVKGRQLTFGAGGSIAPGINGLSIKGESTGARASVPIDLSAHQKISVAFWLYWPAYANNDALAFEFTAQASSVSSKGFYVDPNAANGRFQLAACQTDVRAVSFTRPTAAAWHHYVVTYDFTSTTAIAAYVDGVGQSLTVDAAGSGSGSFFANSTLYLLSRNNASLLGTGRLQELTLFKDVLTAEDAINLCRESWQLFAPTVKRIYFTAPAGGVTASLTGVSSTTAVGALSTSAGVSQSLTGVSSPAGIGSLGVSAGASSTLSGVASVAAVGSLSSSAGVGIALTGVASSSGIGPLAASISYSVSLTGVAAASYAGSLSIAANVNQTLNGVSSTCSAGSLVASIEGVVPKASRRRITLINRVDRSSLVRRVSRKTII